MASISPKALTNETFKCLSAGITCPKPDLNALILDYLTMEGYTEAAARFSKEANIQPLQTLEDTKIRQQIKQAIHAGNIQEAIDRVNTLDYQILENNPSLHFALLRLQLVELIRSSTGGDIFPGLQFAKKHLAPRAPVKAEFLSELEKTMALFIFPHDKLEPDIAYLLEPKLRCDVADMINQVITYKQSSQHEAAIRNLVRLRQWSEQVVKGSHKDISNRLELNIHGDDCEEVGRRTRENDHDPMIT